MSEGGQPRDDVEVCRPPIESFWPCPRLLLLYLHSYLDFVTVPNPEEAVTLDVDGSEVVVDTCSMCSMYWSLSEIVMPRYLTDLLLRTVFSFRRIVGSRLKFPFSIRFNIRFKFSPRISWAYWYHTIWEVAYWYFGPCVLIRLCYHLWRVPAGQPAYAMFAADISTLSRLCSRSSIMISQKMGPHIDPCGHPFIIRLFICSPEDRMHTYLSWQ